MTDPDLVVKLDEVLRALEQARIELAAQQVLIAQDRVQMARLIVLVGRLLEGQGRSKDAAELVANNLADSIARADDVDGEPGAAADAGVRSAVDDLKAESKDH